MLLSLLLMAAPASAGLEAYSNDPIVIVGQRDGGTVLVVDVREVALRCARCQPALEELAILAEPYVQARGEMRRDMESFAQTGQSHNRHVGIQMSPISQDAKRERLQFMWDGLFKEQRKEVSGKRNEFRQQAKGYLLELAPHIVEIAEAERVKRGASAVVNSRRASVGKAKRVDITDEVIRQLDAKPFIINLPRPGGTADQGTGGVSGG